MCSYRLSTNLFINHYHIIIIIRVNLDVLIQCVWTFCLSVCTDQSRNSSNSIEGRSHLRQTFLNWIRTAPGLELGLNRMK